MLTLSNAIGEFFSSLQQIAAAPDDQAPRIISIEKGKGSCWTI